VGLFPMKFRSQPDENGIGEQNSIFGSDIQVVKLLIFCLHHGEEDNGLTSPQYPNL